MSKLLPVIREITLNLLIFLESFQECAKRPVEPFIR
jgi:hypothetical protein